ncbi:MAG: hypothetical protein ABI980_10265 [Nitrospirota bacterium]
METITSREETLVAFGIGVVALSQLLDEDRPLNPEDVLFIDNNVRLFQFAYQKWSRHHPIIPSLVN